MVDRKFSTLELIGIGLIAGCLPVYGAMVREFVFENAPFASAHASTIVQLRTGGLMACWFGGTAEGKPDVAIWCARRTADRWERLFLAVREPNTACYNPVLFYNREGRLWLYYKFGSNPASWSAGRVSSLDDGKTWSEVEHLPPGIFGPIRTKPLLLPNGTIISGSSVETRDAWTSFIERSSDGGFAWSKIGPIAFDEASAKPLSGELLGKGHGRADVSGIIQPALVSLGGGHLMLYARPTIRTARICISESTDGGLNWSVAHPLLLPNPNSGIDAVNLRDGRIVLVYNKSAVARTPLNVAVSQDGKSFRDFAVLEEGAGEYSYPAIVQGSEGDIHITYTWLRKRIRYVRIPLADVP
jgi:predicted neuraminidase